MSTDRFPNGPTPLIDRVGDLLDIIADETRLNERLLEKFRESFDNNPRHALERGGDAFQAAANLDNLIEMRYALTALVDNPDTVSTDAVLRRLDSHFFHNIRLGGVSGSSGGSHRLMASAIVDASATWFDTYPSGLSRIRFVKALDAFNADRNW